MIDAVVAGVFLALVSVIILLSLREWMLLISRRKPAHLHEAKSVWLPDHAIKEGGANLRTAGGTAAIALGLAKELAGEAALERARQAEVVCVCEQENPDPHSRSDGKRYVEMTEHRLRTIEHQFKSLYKPFKRL